MTLDDMLARLQAISDTVFEEHHKDHGGHTARALEKTQRQIAVATVLAELAARITALEGRDPYR